MKDKIAIILRDAEGFVSYRNKVYGLSQTWPDSFLSKLRIAINLFRLNANGFRDICYYRLKRGYLKRFLKLFYPPTSNLILDIGIIAEGGCMFHHAFSTYINAEHIGYQCTFRNNVTVGNKNVGGKLCRPYFENNVFCGPNAVIIGDVRIGHDAIIGAGAVVTKDVPPYGVVIGNPGKIIKINSPQ